MYKNIIFDLGGVVVDFKPRDFLMDHFLNKSAEDEVFDLTFGSKEWEELDRGVECSACWGGTMICSFPGPLSKP